MTKVHLLIWVLGEISSDMMLSGVGKFFCAEERDEGTNPNVGDLGCILQQTLFISFDVIYVTFHTLDKFVIIFSSDHLSFHSSTFSVHELQYVGMF